MIKSSVLRLFLLPLFCVSLLLVAGCGGCTDDDSGKTAAEKKKEAEEKRKEEEKANFDAKHPVVLPGQYFDELKSNRTKLGHWVASDFRVIANKFDTLGDLDAHSVDTYVKPVPVEATNYFARSTRPVSLPKEEWRNLETTVYLPKRDGAKSAAVRYSMNNSVNGLPQIERTGPTLLMKAHQYHMVVLTNRPAAYAYVNLLDSVVLPDIGYNGERLPPFYYVVRTDPKKNPIPLPRQSLNWTTIAYLVWDDLEADQLDQEQQQALVDWIHFGGQLVLSGPDCLDKLRNSFLSEYLPAQFDGTHNLTSQEFSEINEHWSVPVKNSPGQKHEFKINDQFTLLGVDFKPHPKSQFVPNTGKLAIERQVGRGRIVATAFSLDAQPVVLWPSFKSFFNGCLLRRLPRKFGKTNESFLLHAWVGDEASIFDPLVGSTLRYTSRDLSASGGTHRDSNVKMGAAGEPKDYSLNPWMGRQRPAEEFYRLPGQNAAERRTLDDHWHYGGFQHDEIAGTAGWNDSSGISNAARDTLKDAAGITPPSSSFVLKMLAVYLIVLVPVNWAIFRMIGRVEWAWVAAPFIAIMGAFTVAKMASLDIGFVRSNSQVGLIEIYSDYSRGHLSQYSALYTSLSTGYNVDLDNPTAQSLPFGHGDNFKADESLKSVTMRRTLSNRLEGFQIRSNTTGMLHTELMLDVGGRFSYADDAESATVENGTNIDLTSSGVVRRTSDGQLEFAWIGDLNSAGNSGPLTFKSINGKDTDEEIRSQWLQKNISFQSTPYLAQKYWDQVAGEAEEVAVANFRLVPELNNHWVAFMQVVRGIQNDVAPSEFTDEMEIDAATFERIFERYYSQPSINVSRLFDAVVENLKLGHGESRLIGVTKQSLGENRFSPKSTQTDQETLVLVHLKRPKFRSTGPDINLMTDFTKTQTTADWEEAMEEFTEGTDENAEGESEDSKSDDTKSDGSETANGEK